MKWEENRPFNLAYFCAAVFNLRWVQLQNRNQPMPLLHSYVVCFLLASLPTHNELIEFPKPIPRELWKLAKQCGENIPVTRPPLLTLTLF